MGISKYKDLSSKMIRYKLSDFQKYILDSAMKDYFSYENKENIKDLIKAGREKDLEFGSILGKSLCYSIDNNSVELTSFPSINHKITEYKSLIAESDKEQDNVKNISYESAFIIIALFDGYNKAIMELSRVSRDNDNIVKERLHYISRLITFTCFNNDELKEISSNINYLYSYEDNNIKDFDESKVMNVFSVEQIAEDKRRQK